MGIALATLTGCAGLAPTKSSGPVAVAGAAMHGNVHGGQQPVVNAILQLYATGNTGYGSAYAYTAGTSLLGNNVVQTDSNGSFSIAANQYTCPSFATPVYLVATGGNPGLSNPSANNANLALMVALGPCGSLGSLPGVQLNELTTVASVWALSPFMTGLANVGTSSTNAFGLSNAFAAVNKLVNISTGAVSGTALPANAILPTAKINTLADILASCINSGGGTAGDGSACGRLFTDTSNGTAPTDTITAAMNIAQHPSTQVTPLTVLATTTSPFQPTLASPTDFSLVVTYSGGGLSTPKGIAVDSSGSVWLPNAGNNSVTKLSNAGAAISGTNGFTAGSLSSPSAVAIDQSGNAWITNSGSSTVTMLNQNGSSPAIYTGANLNYPTSVAVDASSNIWIGNAGTSGITQISAMGVLTSYAGTGITSPTAIAIDPK
jgi:hypothetical protein